MKRKLLEQLSWVTVPALELAISGDDKVRINNIIHQQHQDIGRATGVYIEDKDWYELYTDNLNGYVSHIVAELNDIFGE